MKNLEITSNERIRYTFIYYIIRPYKGRQFVGMCSWWNRKSKQIWRNNPRRHSFHNLWVMKILWMRHA